MSNHEQIYALFVEANPYPDVDSLPETLESAMHPLHAVGSPADEAKSERRQPSSRQHRVGAVRPRGWRLATIAAAVVIVVGLAGIVVRDVSTSDSSTGIGTAELTATEQAVAFVSRLNAGDAGGAEGYLGDPVSTIWFVPIGRLSDPVQVRNYLDFYVAMGIDTQTDGCVERPLGPFTEVVCHASQTPGILSELELEVPAFDITFKVWDSGIQEVSWDREKSQEFDVAFSQSRFFEFRDAVLRPMELVQPNGDPVWSKENGEIMWDLIEDFVAGGS
ncbi:MAG: hypothetical protein ACR2N2_01650 [Acidimicrobiia bacterium]